MTATSPPPPPAAVPPTAALPVWGLSSPPPKPPPPLQVWMLAAAAGVGLLAATVLPGAPRPGVGVTACAVAGAVPLAVLVHRRGARRRAARAGRGAGPEAGPKPGPEAGVRAGRRRPVGVVEALLLGVAVALSAVAAVRACEWLAVGCALAGACLAAAVALDARRWDAVLGVPVALARVTLRTVPALAPVVRPLVSLRGLRPWLTGGAVAAGSAVVVAGLLMSADDAFAGLVDPLMLGFDPARLGGRVITFGLVAVAVVGFLAAAVDERPGPGRRSGPGRRPGPGAGPARHPAEWLTPLVVVAVVIAAFLAVEATVLFGGAQVVERLATTSHADRARQGFGQLTVVTLIVLGLLGWCGRRSAGGPPSHRRSMGLAGGLLLLLSLLLAVSALRRLWLYQAATAGP